MQKLTAWIGANLVWVSLTCGQSLCLAQDDPTARTTADSKPPGQDASVATQAAGGADEPAEWLKKKGLTRQGRLFVLDEVAAIGKYEEARRHSLSLQKASLQASQIDQYDAAIQDLNQQAEVLKQRVAALQSQINASNVGSRRGRVRQFTQQQQAPLRNEQSQAKALLAQINSQIQAAKAKAPKTDDRKNAPSEIANARRSYVAAVLELETELVPLLKRYQELGKDQDVIKALERVEQKEKRAYKLGPSPTITAASRMVAEVKKSLPQTPKPSTKPSTKKPKTATEKK